MNIGEQIRKLETGILANQQELSRIMYHYNQAETKDPVIRQQIINCKENIENLKKQVAALESLVNMNVDISTGPVIPNQAAKTVQPAPAAVKPQPTVQTVVSQPAPQPIVKPAPQPVVKPKAEPKPKKNMETALGKSVMGIIASVLIFISFVLFSALLIPALTDTVKLICLFGVSAIFLGLGMFKLRKQPKSPLWLSVAGCGTGGLYIALFIGDLVFNVYGDLILYICLLFWCIGVCYLSRRKSKIFQIIGLIGVLISVIMGAATCTDSTMMLCLVIYTIVAMVVFRASHFNQEDYYKNWLSVLTNMISVIALMSMGDKEAWAGLYIIAAYVVLELVYNFFFAKPGSREYVLGFSIFSYTIILIECLNIIIPLTLFDGIDIVIALAVIVIAHIFTERISWSKNSVTNTVLVVLATLSYIALSGIAILDHKWYIPLQLIAVLYLLWHRLSGRDVYRWLSLVIAFSGLLTLALNDVFLMIMSALYIAGTWAITYIKPKKYSSAYTLINYFFSLMYTAFFTFAITSLIDLSAENSLLCVMVMMGIVNVLVMKLPVFKNPVTGEKDKVLHPATIAINTIFMCITWIAALVTDNWGYIVLATVLFSVNTKEQLEKETFFPSMLVGIKYTLLLTAMMITAEVEGLIISIVFIAVAILSIVLGFVIKRKGLRVYGLILSLISVVKLVLIDIDYDNSLMRALSFFICGVLCFGISFIYNLVDKKMKVTENESKPEALN